MLQADDHWFVNKQVSATGKQENAEARDIRGAIHVQQKPYPGHHTEGSAGEIDPESMPIDVHANRFRGANSRSSPPGWRCCISSSPALPERDRGRGGTASLRGWRRTRTRRRWTPVRRPRSPGWWYLDTGAVAGGKDRADQARARPVKPARSTCRAPRPPRWRRSHSRIGFRPHPMSGVQLQVLRHPWRATGLPVPESRHRVEKGRFGSGAVR